MQARPNSDPFDDRTYTICFVLMMTGSALFGFGIPATILESLGMALLPALLITAVGALLLGILVLMRKEVATFLLMMGLIVMSVVIACFAAVEPFLQNERVRVAREEFHSYVVTVTTTRHLHTSPIGIVFLLLVAACMMTTGVRYLKQLGRTAAPAVCEGEAHG